MTAKTRYFAIVHSSRTHDKPYRIFRATGFRTDVYDGDGWTDNPYFVKYLLGEIGPDEITKEDAEKLIADGRAG